MQGNASKKTALEQLGVSFAKPKYPSYSVLVTRVSTFSSWNHYQPADTMAKAGFFYTGNGDNVRCFFCGNGLENWEREDDPWVEHAHWFPECVFLIQCKGKSFVLEVQQIVAQRQSQQDRATKHETGSFNQYNKERGVVSAPSSPDCSLQSVAAITALQMGYSEVMVKKAIRDWNSRNGSVSFSVADIVNLILDYQESDHGYGSLEDLQQEKSISVSDSRTETSNLNDNKSIGNNRTTLTKNSDNNSMQTDRTMSPLTDNKHDSEDKSSTDSGYDSDSENESERTGDSILISERETEKLRAENKQLRETLICKVCMDDTVSVIFLPCTHMVTCAQCFPAMKHCPVCRSDVKAIVKAYLV
ncbi:baculoviral IAP repeat-containing protein 3-like [Saccostrea echinata]|uniref:baculoviral IAP repeat-containing protein 3-like n=1 Tax=Saccostrea echinata TaxID=191078 RepID=UPI002A7F1436|nr:baculoviral IAP repeat-containing protein 3-like [Saccostrea echinata]